MESRLLELFDIAILNELLFKKLSFPSSFSAENSKSSQLLSRLDFRRFDSKRDYLYIEGSKVIIGNHLKSEHEMVQIDLSSFD